MEDVLPPRLLAAKTRSASASFHRLCQERIAERGKKTDDATGLFCRNPFHRFAKFLSWSSTALYDVV